MPPLPLQVRVLRRWSEALDIDAFELVADGRVPLPPFEAGAHIDIEVAPGLVRQYSLCNDPRERHRYLIGVLRVPDSRGGSSAAHERLVAGASVRIGLPRNNFALAPHATRHLLLAGGIGLTPLLSMAHHLSAQGADFQLHAFVRSRARAAFVPVLQSEPLGRHSRLHVDDADDGVHFDFRACLQQQPDGTHAYVCGPAGFLQHMLDIARDLGWPSSRLHQESFSALTPAAKNDDPAFELELVRSGRIVVVPSGLTALQALRVAGIEIASSCEAGVCGTCLTRVLRGSPMHRDAYLTDDERAGGNAFLPCCSRAAEGTRLSIDL